jgi:hypothetical protein
MNNFDYNDISPYSPFEPLHRYKHFHVSRYCTILYGISLHTSTPTSGEHCSLVICFSNALICVHTTLELISNSTWCNLTENWRILMLLTKIYTSSTLQHNKLSNMTKIEAFFLFLIFTWRVIFILCCTYSVARLKLLTRFCWTNAVQQVKRKSQRSCFYVTFFSSVQHDTTNVLGNFRLQLCTQTEMLMAM